MGQHGSKDDREERINDAIYNLDSETKDARAKMKEFNNIVGKMETNLEILKKEREHIRQVLLNSHGIIKETKKPLLTPISTMKDISGSYFQNNAIVNSGAIHNICHSKLKTEDEANPSDRAREAGDIYTWNDKKYSIMVKENQDIRQHGKHFESYKREFVDLNEKLRLKDTEMKEKGEIFQENIHRNNELSRELQSQKDHNQQLGTRLEELERQLSILKCENRDLKKDIDIKEKVIRNERAEMALTVRDEKFRSEQIISKLEYIESQRNDMTITISKCETDLALKESECEEIQQQLELLQVELRALRTEKEKVKQRVRKQITFRSALREPQSNQAIHDIVTLLQERLSNVDLEVISESSRNINVPLIVIFYHLSRMTDDARGAMTGLEATSDIALVVLHPKKVIQSSHEAKKILAAPEFKKLGVIVDISFLSATGIIRNEHTSTAIDKLLQFINK